MKFTKMQGCGNDYLYVDGSKERILQQEKPRLVRLLSDRHFGVGGDGVIFINPSTAADFEMEMYNADGSRSAMCGNGIRCVAKYVYDKGLTDKTERLAIMSGGQVKYLDLTVENGRVSRVKVDMGEPVLEPARIPVLAQGDSAVNEEIFVQGREYRMTCVSMGNPHAVVFWENVPALKIEEIGPAFEKHERFPERTNTEFIEVLEPGRVRMRVWERGTGETLACGTGCCAAAVACVLNGKTDTYVTVEVPGGEIDVFWDQKENRVYMTGPAVTVFEGDVDLTLLSENGRK